MFLRGVATNVEAEFQLTLLALETRELGLGLISFLYHLSRCDIIARHVSVWKRRKSVRRKRRRKSRRRRRRRKTYHMPLSC